MAVLGRWGRDEPSPSCHIRRGVSGREGVISSQALTSTSPAGASSPPDRCAAEGGGGGALYTGASPPLLSSGSEQHTGGKWGEHQALEALGQCAGHWGACVKSTAADAPLVSG